MDRLKGRWPGLHRFLTTQESPYPFLRDVAIGGLVILLVLSSLWIYTGRWGHSPVVVVESGSMMHCSNGLMPLGRDCDSGRYGRIGTIDPGDLIFVKDAGGKGSIETYAEDGQDRYGSPGDVIVYRPNGEDLRTPVIHRALFWLEVEADGTFTIDALGIDHVSDLDDQRLQALRLPSGYAETLRDPALTPLCGAPGPTRSGFVTRGDNNPLTDQASPHEAIAVCPVKPDWVVGKARGEVPWLGLVKLLVTDILGTSSAPNYHNAAGDCKVMLWLTLAVLIGGPYAYEKVKNRGRRSGQPPAEPPTH
jgi:signal peptidase